MAGAGVAAEKQWRQCGASAQRRIETARNINV